MAVTIEGLSDPSNWYFVQSLTPIGSKRQTPTVLQVHYLDKDGIHHRAEWRDTSPPDRIAGLEAELRACIESWFGRLGCEVLSVMLIHESQQEIEDSGLNAVPETMFGKQP